MGKVVAGIIFLALAVYIVAVAVDDIKQAKVTAREIGAASTSVSAKANEEVVRYSGYLIGSLGVILITAGITRKMKPK